MGCRQAAIIRAIPHTEGATRRGDSGKLEGEGRSPSTAGLERWRRSAARPCLQYLSIEKTAEQALKTAEQARR